MKILEDAIRTEQAKFNNKPVAKLGIRTFQEPITDEHIVYGSLNWNKIWTGMYSIDADPFAWCRPFTGVKNPPGGDNIGPACCCTWRGTLLVLDANSTLHRYPNAGPDTDF